MKYFIDIQCIEKIKVPIFGKRRHCIDLVSIGIVAENGREYYAIANDFRYWDASDFMRKHVLLPLWIEAYHEIPQSLKLTTFQRVIGKTQETIASEIYQFFDGGPDALSLGRSVEDDIEIYGYCSQRDWVVFCSFFGTTEQLPKGFPKYFMDLQQTMKEGRITAEWELRNCPGPAQMHNALENAKWMKRLYNAIQQAKQSPCPVLTAQ